MAYIGKQPAVAALTASDITDGIVSNAKLAQDIISADTALGATPADTDEFLVSDAGTLKRMDYSYIKSTNTPAFLAKVGTTTALSDAATTLAPMDTEVFDTDNAYNNTASNYKFTPQTAGKYFVYAQARLSDGDQTSLNYCQASIYKNGSEHFLAYYDFRDNPLMGMEVSVNGVIDMNGSSDYIDFRVMMSGNNDGDEVITSGNPSRFGAYKIIE
jgi:hypothetical protein